MIDPADIYLTKAEESLDGAESEFANSRYNNCANRCYYASYQAAIAALIRTGTTPQRRRRRWDHAFVQAEFIRRLMNRQKVYPARLRTVLSTNQNLRHTADYQSDRVKRTEASRALRRSREFVSAISQEVNRHEN